MQHSALSIGEKLKENIKQVIIGKDLVIDLVLIALMSKGHVLLEDIPGIGKTTLVHALAKSLNLTFNRIQFTPDVMPSDVVGFNVYNPKIHDFEYRPGAVLSQLILADEINRTSPKTQSSLLEVMQENQITVEGTTYALPHPFMVLATQNPIEQTGTYPLPEAQLDRFMLKIALGYPNKEEEIQILNRFSEEDPMEELQTVATVEDIIKLQKASNAIYVSEPIKKYIVDLANTSRNHSDIRLGVSPRASLMLMQAAKSRALLQNRNYVLPEDIQYLFPYVFSHRIILNPESLLNNTTIQMVLNNILMQTMVPEQ